MRLSCYLDLHMTYHKTSVDSTVASNYSNLDTWLLVMVN